MNDRHWRLDNELDPYEIFGAPDTIEARLKALEEWRRHAPNWIRDPGKGWTIMPPDSEPKPDLADGFSEALGEVHAAFSDPVDHPPHYTSHPSGVECIEITEHMNFCLGNVIKYVMRSGLKGEALEDLRKARWYLDREIERMTRAVP